MRRGAPFGKFELIGFGLFALLLGATVLGCDRAPKPPDPDARAREFSRLNPLVVALQRAPNTDKEAPLSALRASSCQTLCEFRATCLAAYDMHVSALRDIRRIQAAVTERSADPVLLERTEKMLGEAAPLMQKCAGLQGELERSLSRF